MKWSLLRNQKLKQIFYNLKDVCKVFTFRFSVGETQYGEMCFRCIIILSNMTVVIAIINAIFCFDS